MIVFLQKNSFMVNRSEIGIAETYFVYSLENNNGIWLWIERENVNTQCGERNKIRKAEVIPSFEITDKEARKFIIYKIAEIWKKKEPYTFNVDGEELLRCLKKEFL